MTKTKNMPQYPVYIPSKGRWDKCLTAKFLVRDEVPFHLVVEKQEAENYAKTYGDERVLVLPFRDKGTVVPARNWIREHSQEQGFKRHWQLDDNIRSIIRLYKGKRIPYPAGTAMRVAEDFTERYENIGITGFNYRGFARSKIPPFFLNCHVYSATLFWNELPYHWRGIYNEDTDLCLQVLSGGYCTVEINTFLIEKEQTMKMSGGNTDALYHGHGRTKMSRELEARWPHLVETVRRWDRAQHKIKDEWRSFDTPLIKKKGLRLKESSDEYGVDLVKKKDIQSEVLQKIYKDFNE